MGFNTPLILGYDAAGVVEEVGDGVSQLRPGDKVYYTPEVDSGAGGTHAEYHVVPASIVEQMPNGLTYIEAASIPLAGGTAWEAVIRRLGIRPGETILIQGGAGGVGSFAVQFAKAVGAKVIASASGGNQQALIDLGADIAINYETQDPVEVCLKVSSGSGVDAAFDIAGERIVSRSIPALKSFGRIACILRPEGTLEGLRRKNLTLHGVHLACEKARLREMRALFEAGAVRPLVDEVLPLSKIAQAHRRLDTGHGRGKVVLDVMEG